LLIVGVVQTIGTLLLSLWGTGMLIAALTDGQGFRAKERGLLYFAAFAATLPVIAWLSRLWWQHLHRLPRTFACECRACKWSMTVRVVDTSAPIQVAGAVPLVQRLEFEGIPLLPDPIDAKRERQQWRIERERRQARQREQELPPNSDFDFRNSTSPGNRA
jgi:hypothetical protein